MIPFLKIRAMTAAVVFLSTLGVMAGLSRAQNAYPDLLQFTGGDMDRGFFGGIRDFFTDLFN